MHVLTRCVSHMGVCGWMDRQLGRQRQGHSLMLKGFILQDRWSPGATTILSAALYCLGPQLPHKATWLPLTTAYLFDLAGS